MSFLKTLQAQGLIDEKSRQKLSSFVDLLLEWNQRINLTGFRSRLEIEEILVGESILALRFLQVSGKTILDFGSGAGIPGLVWALSNPTVLLTSVESTQKKVAFQKEVLRQTGSEAEILWGRFPESVEARSFDVITSRAIRFSANSWDAARSLLNSGGQMVRFAIRGTERKGWVRHSLSDRSDLLVSASA